MKFTPTLRLLSFVCLGLGVWPVKASEDIETVRPLPWRPLTIKLLNEPEHFSSIQANLKNFLYVDNKVPFGEGWAYREVLKTQCQGFLTSRLISAESVDVIARIYKHYKSFHFTPPYIFQICQDEISLYGRIFSRTDNLYHCCNTQIEEAFYHIVSNTSLPKDQWKLRLMQLKEMQKFIHPDDIHWKRFQKRMLQTTLALAEDNCAASKDKQQDILSLRTNLAKIMYGIFNHLQSTPEDKKEAIDILKDLFFMLPLSSNQTYIREPITNFHKTQITAASCTLDTINQSLFDIQTLRSSAQTKEHKWLASMIAIDILTLVQSTTWKGARYKERLLLEYQEAIKNASSQDIVEKLEKELEDLTLKNAQGKIIPHSIGDIDLEVNSDNEDRWEEEDDDSESTHV